MIAMMDASTEKAINGVEGPALPKPSALRTPETNSVGDSDSAPLEPMEKPAQAMVDDQYPHGLKLVLLAGATIVAFFLIALDQVSGSAGLLQMLYGNNCSQKGTPRQLLAPRYPRSRTSSMASATCHGMLLRIS